VSITIARTDSSVVGRWWWTVDRWLLGAFTALIIIGLILVPAASPAVAERLGLDTFHFVKKQLIFLSMGIVAMLGISLMNPKTVRRLATVAFAGAVLMVIFTILFGAETNGARRWMSIAGFTVQPSEFMKPAFAVVTAWLFASQHKDDRFPGYRISIAVYLFTVCLLMLQPDFGMTVVVSCIWGAQFFMAGLSFAIIAGLGILAVGGAVGIYYTFPHVTSRIDRFLDPSTGDNFQIEKSLDAVRNGGWFGTGPGQGEIKLILPDAHTDFIFSVAAEELGLIVTLLIISVFVFIVVRGFMRIRQSDDIFVILAAGGLLVQFGIQSFIHMGSSIKLLPAKGMTLPFISYGGSSMLALCFACGMLLALTRKSATGGYSQ